MVPLGASFNFKEAFMPLYTSPDVSQKASLVATTEVTGDYTVTTDDFMISVHDTVEPVSILMPPIASVPVGRKYIIIDESGTANTNIITVVAAVGETINLASASPINARHGSMTLVARPVGWQII